MDRSCDLSLPRCILYHCINNQWISTRNGETPDDSEVDFLGIYCFAPPTWRTVAKSFKTFALLHSAVCNARPIANVWRPCRPSLGTNAELSASRHALRQPWGKFRPKSMMEPVNRLSAIYLTKMYGKVSHSMCACMCVILKSRFSILTKLGC